MRQNKNDRMNGDAVKFSRRGFLVRTFLSSIAGVAVALFSAKGRAQAKSTKEQAQYTETTDQGIYCKACAYFRPPHSCKIVDGEISPTGWCSLWDFEDRF